jgi:hypothetical protein
MYPSYSPKDGTAHKQTHVASRDRAYGTNTINHDESIDFNYIRKRCSLHIPKLPIGF